MDKVAPANPDKPMVSAPDEQTPDVPTIPLQAGPRMPKVPTGGYDGADAADDLEKIDFGKGNADSAEALKNAQDAQNKMVFANQLGRSANMLGAAIAKVDPQGDELYKDNIKNAQQIVPQQQALAQKLKNDPNSPMAKGMRQFLKSFGFDVKGDATVEDMKTITPLAQKYFDKMEDRDMRRDLADQRSEDRKLQYEMMGQQKKTAADAKADTEAQKQIESLGKIMSGDAGRSGALGQERAKLNSIKHAMGIFNGSENLNDLTDAQSVEVARAMDRVISGGNPTISATEELTPQSARGWIAKKLQYALNTPQGQGQGPFMDKYRDMLNTQYNVTSDNIAQGAMRLASPYIKYKDHPSMQAMLTANELPPDMFDRITQRQLGGVQKYKDLMNQGMDSRQAMIQSGLATQLDDRHRKDDPTQGGGMAPQTTNVSPNTMKMINSRSDDENMKRLQQLRQKYKGGSSPKSTESGSVNPGSNKSTASMLPDSLFNTIGQIESANNPNAKNPRSTATGRYQFTNGTWNDIANKHPELGLTADGRTDDDQADKAMRVFTQQNVRTLASNGIEPSVNNIYASHFLGAPKTVDVLSSPDTARLSTIVGHNVMKANHFPKNMTVSQFKEWIDNKVSDAQDQIGDDGDGT